MDSEMNWRPRRSFSRPSAWVTHVQCLLTCMCTATPNNNPKHPAPAGGTQPEGYIP